MARQLLGQKKVNKLIKETKLNIVKVMVRGGTNHRLDLCVNGGEVFNLYKTGELIKSDGKWC